MIQEVIEVRIPIVQFHGYIISPASHTSPTQKRWIETIEVTNSNPIQGEMLGYECV